MPSHSFFRHQYFLWIMALALLASGTILLAACGATSSANTSTPTATTASVAQQTPTPTPTQQAPTPTPTPASNGNTFQVSIAGSFNFLPGTLTVPKGATVIWTNHSSVGHTVTSDTNAFASNGTIPEGQTFQMVFTTAGTYTYHCAIHTYMKGTIIVTP
jgi:plastocyanin